MRWYLPFCAVLVLGCGSRSGLLDVSRVVPSGGSGGSTPAGGSGGTGGVEVGGTGGSTECTTMTRLEESVSVEKPADGSDIIPALTRLTGDPEDVALAFIRGTHQGADDFFALQHVTFSPWGLWPPSSELGPSFTAFVSTSAVDEMRVAPSLPSRIAMLSAVPECLFAPHVPIDADNTGEPIGLGGGSSTAFLVARELDLLAYGCSTPNLLRVAVYGSTGSAGANAACATSAVFGGAAAHEDGWLLAVSNGVNAPLGHCGIAPELAGEPTRIDVAKLPVVGDLEHLASFEVPTPVIALQVVPHPDGMYIVWRESSAAGAPPIRWTRYVASSGSFVGPGEISTPDEYPLELATTAVGDRLAIAYGNDPANNPPDLVVKVMDGSGAMLATRTFEPGGFFGHVALIASPDQHSLLVATEHDEAKSRIDVTRFDCVP